MINETVNLIESLPQFQRVIGEMTVSKKPDNVKMPHTQRIFGSEYLSLRLSDLVATFFVTKALIQEGLRLLL